MTPREMKIMIEDYAREVFDPWIYKTRVEVDFENQLMMFKVETNTVIHGVNVDGNNKKCKK